MNRRERGLDAIAGVVFDAVGTLIRPEPSVAEAYTASARRQGIELDVGSVKARFQTHFHSDRVDGPEGFLSTDESTEWRRWRRIVSKVLPEIPDPDLAFEELWVHFGRPEMWRTFPDVVATLQGLRELGLEVWIGSNFDSRLRPVVAGLPELADLVPRLLISSEVGYRKPHPKFFQAACDRMGLPPEQVVCVGDDLENDVLGARRAGLEGVHLVRGGHAAIDPQVVTDLTELIGLGAVQA
jgi:putative hydrolase of the HAD superfamily